MESGRSQGDVLTFWSAEEGIHFTAIPATNTTRCRYIKLERIRSPGHALTKPGGFFIWRYYVCFGAQMSMSFIMKSK